MMGVLIDLNTVNEDEEDNNNSNNSSGNNYQNTLQNLCASSSSSVCMELWHACAGPLISLPKKGSLVVYLPQGHLEEQNQQNNLPEFDFSSGIINTNNNISSNNIYNHTFDSHQNNIPPHVFCRVLDVKLHAEVATDEVYAQVSLIPESQFEEKLKESETDVDGDEEDFEDIVKSTTPHMFCKTLTASDTSTHGGFSVPRRAAEDCFPPLDYKQQRPSQELVAKDLHGLEWRFRHIYRGQPRRHLLTTGWSAFVNKKKLVSGDAVLFLRGADGELRLGIRRAVQLKGPTSFSALPTRPMSNNSVSAAFDAISSGRVFNVCYNPRASSSEFVVPLRRFLKSLDTSFNVGMRFKMRFEAEDAGERRYTGVVTGIAELDPMRWSGSKWRCLMVRWDDVEVNRHGRVSPWEIEPTGSFPSPSSLMASGLKRSRIGLPLTKPEFPIPSGVGMPDFGESMGFRKVLQGQEKLGSRSACDGNDNPHLSSSDPGRCYPSSIPPGDFGRTAKGIGFRESFQFQKVLQGQEIRHLSPAQVDGFTSSANRGHEGGGPLEIYEGVQVPNCGNGWLKAQVSSPSSVLMFPHPSIQQARSFRSPICQPRLMSMEHMNYSGVPAYNSLSKASDELVPAGKASCRLFGFSLTEGEHRVVKERNHNSSFPPPETSFWPLVEGQPCYKSPSVTKVGSNCPGANDLYAVRDMLLDIAL
ncbi:auxin response factor 3-like [Chenopodium quinoa]|uniref:auxin response factor 3-like n=1 Tax=Chenopodium quinoa TaxID=63459 RepID=UPI000B78B41B|nr:auxin response factor 3-like [Chenopodium quinoa]